MAAKRYHRNKFQNLFLAVGEQNKWFAEVFTLLWLQVHTPVGNLSPFLDTGEVFSWGDNKAGQLGLGHYQNQQTPQLVQVFT